MLYHLVTELTWGRSIGKRLFAVTIESQGAPPTARQTLIRNLLRAVDFLPAWYLLAFFCIRLDPTHRRLGDWAAATTVTAQ